jgi:hypothetical protein
MLSILALIAVAFSYTSRLDGVSSDNFARATADRSASASGLPLAITSLDESTSMASTLQPWSEAATVTSDNSDDNDADAAAATSARSVVQKQENIKRQAEAMFGAAPGTLTISDLSGRVNINAITSERGFQRFLEAVFASADPQSRSAAAQTRSNAIFKFRGGDKKTSDTLQPDLRRPAPLNTSRFKSLNDLKTHLGRKSGMFQERELEALKNYITVFSEAPEVYNMPDGSSIPRLNLQETSASQLLAVLQQAFPEKESRLLMQFTANVCDYADADDLPTIMPDPSHPELWNSIIGNEQVPLITEVYPDATTSGGGDQGQFVEIYNPWDKSITMSSWQLGVSGGPGIVINEILPSKGYLIVTDNYDQPADESAPETGSFLSIFGTRKDASLRKLLANESFELPDRNAYVTLKDSMGNLIDVFSYTGTAAGNGKISYQRNDPRVRTFQTAQATPFEKPAQGVYTASPEQEMAMVEGWKTGNQALQSPIDLMKVSTSYAGLDGDAGQVMLQPRVWQTPVVVSDQNSETGNLDIGIVDLFYVPQPFAKAVADSQSPVSNLDAEQGTNLKSGEFSDTPTSDGVHYSFGKLNLNTCSRQALFSIDAVVNGQDIITEKLADDFEEFRQKQVNAGAVPFRNPSDFVRQFFPKAGSDDLDGLGQLLNQVSVGSSSFEVTSETYNVENTSKTHKSEKPRRTVATRMKWLIALDIKPYSLVNFTSQP